MMLPFFDLRHTRNRGTNWDKNLRFLEYENALIASWSLKAPFLIWNLICKFLKVSDPNGFLGQ